MRQRMLVPPAGDAAATRVSLVCAGRHRLSCVRRFFAAGLAAGFFLLLAGAAIASLLPKRRQGDGSSCGDEVASFHGTSTAEGQSRVG